MKTPEEIYEANKERRAKELQLNNALSALRQTTERNVVGGIARLLLSCLLLWMIWTGYVFSVEPMTKSDGVVLLVMVYALGATFWQAISMLIVNPRDVVLREMVEDQLKTIRKPYGSSGNESV